MAAKSTNRISVVVPNWNGEHDLPACLDSLLSQTEPCRVIVVENGSTDSSLELLQKNYPQVVVIVHDHNLGFAGGVNAGIRRSITDGDEFVALFNNDAVADPDWLKGLLADLVANDDAGITTCKLLNTERKQLDSTGECYSTWGLPYPRGRDEPRSDKYDTQVAIFGATGGATLYRVSMLKEIGIFDEDFFAYYEDVDISFRAQLAGWKVRYVPEAIAYHQIGATSGKIKGFTTYQTVKNLPWVLHKNAPASIYWRIWPRFFVAYHTFVLAAIARGQIGPALKGYGTMLLLLPKKTGQRWHIQRHRKVEPSYIWSMLTPGLPPNAHRLRKLFHQRKGNI